MYYSPLIKVIAVLYGLFLGSLLPVAFAYLIPFSRKHEFGGKLIVHLLRFILRFLFIFLFYGIIIIPLMIIMHSNWPAWWDDEEIILMIGIGVLAGLIGGAILLIIGFRRGLKRRTSKTQKIA